MKTFICNTACQDQMKNQLYSILSAIEECDYDFDKEYSNYEGPCAADYLEDVLDINYVINADKSYKGVRLLVAFGGPNIWIDTVNQEVQAYWGGDNLVMSYHTDRLEIDDYFEELFNCI